MGISLKDFGSSGAKVWQDDLNPSKTYGVIGPGARSFNLNDALAFDDTTLRPSAFVNTLVGTSPITSGLTSGYPLLITTGATEYNGVNVQLFGESAKLATTTDVRISAKMLASEEKTVDLLFGLAEQKTDLCKLSTAHGVLATGVAGVFFFKVSGASETTIYVKSYVSGAETASVAVGTLGKVDPVELGLQWDGAKVHAFVDGVEKAVFTGSLPAGELTPSYNFRTGATAAFTLSFSDLSYAVAT